jgi:hypothetical protein
VVSHPDACLHKARITVQIDCPDVRQLWSGRWCIVYGVLPIRLQLPGRLPLMVGTHIRYGNCVLKFSRPDAHPLWSERAKPVMEITCSGRASVWTMCHPVWTRFLYRKDFSANFLENPVAQLFVRTTHVHLSEGA